MPPRMSPLKFATNGAAILDLSRSLLRKPLPLLTPCKLVKHSLPMRAWMPTPIIWPFFLFDIYPGASNLAQLV